MKRRCLFGIQDDLHAYAERMHAMRAQLLATTAIASRDYGPVNTVVVHREGRYQTELFTAAPGTVIPPHRHPGVDSIECPVAGFIRFVIDGQDPYEGITDQRLARFALGKLVRIQGSAWHSGVAGPAGAQFLSMQRWPDAPGLIGERWEGGTVSEQHSTLAHASAPPARDFVPLTPEIARAFYGAQPTRTMRGYAYLEGGRPIVIWGLLRDSYRWVLFSEAKPEARTGTFSARRMVVLGTKKLLEMLQAVRGPVHARADEGIEGACALLERLGFEHMTKGVYQWRKPPHSSQPH